MQFFSAAFRLFKMLFACAQFFFTILLFVLNGLRIICKLACVGFPWFLFTSISLLLILTRYFKLKKPSPKIVESVLGEQIDGVNYKDFEDVWPVANRGASLDALENSATAIKKVRIGAQCRTIEPRFAEPSSSVEFWSADCFIQY